MMSSVRPPSARPSSSWWATSPTTLDSKPAGAAKPEGWSTDPAASLKPGVPDRVRPDEEAGAVAVHPCWVGRVSCGASLAHL